MNVIISSEVKNLVPSCKLGVIEYRAVIEKSSDGLVSFFNGITADIESKYITADIAGIPHIKPTRKAYKALGKDPHSYRGAAEQMLRRIILKKGLYFVNNAVDINNVISVTSGYSIGSYDMEKICGDVTLERAPEGTHYKGIGKDDYEYNVEFLPALFDGEGCFGNPSSDSQRTMIKTGKRDVLFVFYAFDGEETPLLEQMERTEALLKEYCREYETLNKYIVE